MRTQNNGFARLSQRVLALTEISKTHISQLEFSESLSPAIQKIVSLAEQIDMASKVF